MSSGIGNDPGASSPSDSQTVGALVHRLSEQIPELIRSEMRLAQAEMAGKGKRLGTGLGILSVSGLVAILGIQVLLAAAVLALALVMPAWAAALLVGAVLLIGAGVGAMLGKGQVEQATPPKPERALDGVREDVATLKGEHR